MTTSFDRFLTVTGTHKNNPTGAAAPSVVSSSVLLTPLDPPGFSDIPTQQYPTEKLFLMRETFTNYSAFATGDFLVVGGVTYAVRAVLPFAAQGEMEAFYRLIVEQQLGS